MNLKSFLTEELWLFILFAIVLALAAPQIGLIITPYAIYFLLVVMFFTSLSIGLADFKQALKHKNFLLKSIFLVYFVSPLIAYLLSPYLEKNLAVGLILYSAIPSAMANAFYIGRLKKNAALALAITAITTLLSPFITPVVVKLLTGQLIELNMFELFLSLFKLIILPFAAAELVRRFSKKLTANLLTVSKPISNICIFFVILGVISKAEGQVWSLGGLAWIMLLLLIAYYGMGYLMGDKNRTVLAFGNAFRNGTLAMVVGLEVFGPTVALVGVMSTLLHNIVLVPIMFKSNH